MYDFISSLINYLKVEAIFKNYGLYIAIIKNVDCLKYVKNSTIKTNNPIRKWAKNMNTFHQRGGTDGK